MDKICTHSTANMGHTTSKALL